MTKTATATPKRLLLSLIGATAVAVLPMAAPVAIADESQGFQISPPVTELRLDPGTSTRSTMKVTNLTGTQMTLTLGKQNFVAKGDEGEVDLVDNANPQYSLAPWFTLVQSSIDVPPKSTKSVEFTISVPKDAEPGGRYGSITFDSQPPKLPAGQSGASVKQRLAGLIFLRINGNAREEISIDSFKTNKSFYEYGPVAFETLVNNKGNVHEKPTGEIVVKNLFGFKTATVKLDEKNVIPGAARKLTNQLQKKLLFGHYTAELTMHNGTSQTLTAKTGFTVIPYKLLAIVFFVILVVVLFFWKARKRLSRAFKILAGKE